MKSNKLTIGLLAHVDSGKTTLAESILYQVGSIRKKGRVDHKDCFLDNNELERNRGITIFSKQAVTKLGNYDVTLLDTPGHIDFSAEMERTLQVLDYAILIISATDGIKGHTKTLWSLLRHYRIPTYIFVNKMDQSVLERDLLIKQIQKELSGNCIDFTLQQSNLCDELAMTDEKLMEEYLETGDITQKSVKEHIKQRKLFPCIFGSALKQEGIEKLIEIIAEYSEPDIYPDEFSGKIYKITRDEKDNKVVHIKITGGTLNVKESIRKNGFDDKSQEKVNQIRIYSGSQYETKNSAECGEICAITGINEVSIGDLLGNEEKAEIPVLNPALSYVVKTQDNCDNIQLFHFLKILEEEDPSLHVFWNKKTDEIQVQIMGEVQIEILTNLIQNRFHIHVEFSSGSILYKETVAGESIGIGHFEPLRHYAEVHLKLEPLERGSGLIFETECQEDKLAKNWQRLILTHLEEKEHIGVLTGSHITDMKITLIAGKAHIKHTEGGDFRQATYRAVRNGLLKNRCVLLEPVYEFSIKVPKENIGKVMSDIKIMCGTFDDPVIDEVYAMITGKCPVSTMKNYQKEITAYTHGKGEISYQVCGYEVCHNENEIISQIGYEPLEDIENPASSVFCQHGVGVSVPWDEVEQYAHIEIENPKEQEEPDEIQIRRNFIEQTISQEEIEQIFKQTYGTSTPKRNHYTKKVIEKDDSGYKGKEMPYNSGKEYLLVDGYNIIFAWDELKKLSEKNIDSAREKLMDILCNYQGFVKCELILVFDAYKVSGGKGSVSKYHNINVVYTKEAETADQYIEKVSHELGKQYRVTVATSDRLEQMIIFGAGAKRMSAKNLYEEVMNTQKEISNHVDENNKGNVMHHLLDQLKKEEIEKIKDSE